MPFVFGIRPGVRYCAIFPGVSPSAGAWLALQALPQGYAPEYRFAYALPENCLKVHAVRHEGISNRPFCLALNTAGDGSLLLTNASRALLLYTEDVRNSRLFDDLFAHMLARKLAALVAVPLLKGNGQKAAELEQLYAASLPPAREAAASERAAKNRRRIPGLPPARAFSK